VRRAHQRPPSTRRPPPLGPQGPLGPQATPVCAPRRSARRPPAPYPKPLETPEAPAPEPSACGRRRRVRSHPRLPSHRLARRTPSVVMGLRVGGRGPGGPSGPGGRLGGRSAAVTGGSLARNGLPESRKPSVAQARAADAFRRRGTLNRWTWTRWTQWTRWTGGWAKRCSDGRMPSDARASGVTHAFRSTAPEPRACGRRRRVRTPARRAHQRPPSTRRPPPLGPQGPLGPQATPVCAPRRSARRPPAPCPKPRETPEAPAPEPSACGRRRRPALRSPR